LPNERKAIKDYDNNSNISSNKNNDNDDLCIVLVSDDPKFSYMFGMSTRISGYDKLSIYDVQSNWLNKVLFLKGSESKIVFIDTESMDLDICSQIFKKIIRQRRDNLIGHNSLGNGPQIRICFLVVHGSVQATYLLELRNEMLDSMAASANQYADIVEKPFTIAEVANILSSELLSLHKDTRTGTNTHKVQEGEIEGRTERSTLSRL
jgi:hypothetical protein